MSQRSEILSKNVEYVGYCDLNKKPGFQMTMYKTPEGKYYLYTASFRHNGWNIVEVTDPKNPRKVKWCEGPWISDVHDGQGTPKIQAADGLLLVAFGGTMYVLHGTPKGNTLPFWGGLRIYDIKTDPENPQFLGEFECKGICGVHRSFYSGGRYAYLTANKEGYYNLILRIIDLADPTHPVEVGSWWSDKMYVANKSSSELPTLGSKECLNLPSFHAVVEKDDVVYAACPNYGMCLIDVKDKTNPKLIGNLPINPPFGGGQAGAACHSILPLGDRPYMVITTEGERARYFANDNPPGLFQKIVKQPMNMIGIAEITDPGNPSLISVFPYPEVPEGYTHGTNFNIVDGVRIPFGPHNIFDAFGQDCYEKRDDRVYCCYFNAGLRIYDVSDPFVPKEIAYFMHPDPQGENWFDNEAGNLNPGPKVSIAEDVLVDDRGYIYFDTYQDGLYIVRCSV
jgi:hypothetical protein